MSGKKLSSVWRCLWILLLCAYCFHSASGYLAYATVYWNGGTVCPSCESGNYTSGYACSSSEGWDEGVKYFMDPTPIGSKVTRVTLDVYGTFGCDTTDPSPAKINIELQQYQVDTVVLPVTSCTCGNCVTMAELERNTPNGWPAYNSSGFNELQVLIYNNEICISYILVTLQYSFSPTLVTALNPSCGPTGGSTIVQVFGAAFVDFSPVCHFGDYSVPATYLSSSELQCIAPSHTASNVNFTVSYPKAVNRSEVRGSVKYQFYNDVELTEVSPDSDSLTGGTNLTIFGENIIDTEPFIRCKFFSQNYSILVIGFFTQAGEVVCSSPQWSAYETTNLSLSLNAQQFSLPIEFTYQSESRFQGKLVWVIFALACIAFICMVLMVIFIIRRFFKKSGPHEKLEANEELDMGDIHIGSVIGTGTFGQVYKAKWKGVTIAIKKLPSSCLSSDLMKEFRKEVSIMRSLTHPNVLQFFGCCMAPPDICLAMEFMCRGSLYSILHNPQLPMNLSLALRLLIDAAKGCLYLHSCSPPIIHRDLKSHNLLVDEHWKVKVCDFGLSAILSSPSQALTACGTPSWTAPEVLRRMHYTMQVDIYSFGIVMFECVTRQEPYDGMSPYMVIFGVANEGLRPTFPPEVPSPYSKVAKECWAEEPEMRPNFSQVLQNLERLKAMCQATSPICGSNQELQQLNSPLPPSVSVNTSQESGNFTYAHQTDNVGGSSNLEMSDSDIDDVNEALLPSDPSIEAILLQ